MLTETRPAAAVTLPAVPPPPPRLVAGRAARLLAPSLLAANAAAIVALWVAHGGAEQFGSPAGDLAAIGQITALLGTFAVLTLLTLISRAPWLERAFGMDHLNHWHRWAGITAVTLLVAHVIASTLAYAVAAGNGLGRQIADFVLYYPNLLAALAGFGLLLLVAVTSARALRRRLRYETWWLLHLYAYLAVALSFAHQITLGSDLTRDPWARGYWIALFAVTAACLLGFRWLLPIVRAFRHRLRVAEVAAESEDVVTLTLRGRRLEGLPAEAGHFFLLRFLRKDRWWKAHPFSLSAAPDGRCLRFTIKALGDDTAALRRIPVGTPVMAEGPYGAFRADRAATERLVLIGGGIGIAPVRALLEGLQLPAGAVTILYRARRREESVLLDEVAALAAAKGYPFFVSYSRGPNPSPDPLCPEALRRLVPDIRRRSVFICGPASMIEAARAGLRAAGVPRSQVIYERFGY